MGEAPKGPPVPRPREEVAIVETSGDEPSNFQLRKHGKLKSSAPIAKPSSSAIASDSDEGSDSDDTKSSVTTLTGTTVTTTAGMDSTESSDEEETDRASSRANVAALANPQGKPSFSGRGSKASMSNHGSSLVKFQGQGQGQQQQQQQRSPPKKTKGQAARIGNGELDDTEDESLRGQDEAVKKSKRTSIRAKSLHRAKIAKDYTTSESEDEVPEARHSSIHHIEPVAIKSISNKSMRTSNSGKFTGPPKSHNVEKNDGNSSTDSETTTDNYDTDDEEEEDHEKEARRRRIHSRKASIHSLPTPKTRALKFADAEDSIPAEFSGRDYSRSDVESHDAELSEEEEEDYDDRHRRKMKRRNQGNSASFSEAVSRNFRWSTVKTKIFYSFRAKGGEDEEGSRVICVKNLAPAVNEQILLEFFGGLGVVAIVNIPKDEFGRCSGPAYVEFESGAAARKALQKSGTKLLERVVFIDVAHETSTSRHVEPKPTSGGIDIHSIFTRKAFHRGDNEESVRNRPTKSHEKSTESLQIPKGYPLATSPGDKIGNELSDPDESTRPKTALGGFRLKLFGSGSNSEKEKLGSQNQSRGIEVQTRGIVFQPRGFDAPQLSTSPGAVIDEEAPNVGSLPLPLPNGQNKKGKWSWGKWRRKHRWAKLWWPWVKKPRWHWWQFANLSARWGKARRQSVKTPASLPSGASEEVNSKDPKTPPPPSPTPTPVAI